MRTFAFLATFHEKSAIIIAAKYFETIRSRAEGERGMVDEDGGRWAVRRCYVAQQAGNFNFLERNYVFILLFQFFAFCFLIIIRI